MFQSSPLVSTFYNRSVLFGIVPDPNNERPTIYVQFKIHLNHADVMIAEKMAYVVSTNLHKNNLSDDWAINLMAIKFAGSFQKVKRFKRVGIESWFLHSFS